MAKTITTQYGSLKLVQARPSLLTQVRAMLPLGLVSLTGRPDKAKVGIVEGCAELALYGVGIPTVRCRDEAMAHQRASLNQELYWLSLKGYLNERFTGAIIPATYVRPCKNQQFESGLACLAFPARKDCSRPFYLGEMRPSEDVEPGMMRMANACIQAHDKARILGGDTMTLKGKPTLQTTESFGQLDVEFMVLGQDIIYLRPVIDPARKIWASLASLNTGRPIIHMPSVLCTIEKGRWAEATDGERLIPCMWGR